MLQKEKLLKPRNKKRIKHSRYFVILLIIYFLLTKTQSLLIEDNFIPEKFNDTLAALLVCFGAIGRFYSMLFIGGKKDRKIVTDGPFSVVRNPLYVCSFVALLGFLLALGRIDILVIVMVAFFFYYGDTVAREEKNLEKEFGKEYLDYKAKTPKYIPDFKLWHTPEFIQVNTKVILKYFVFLVCFLIAIPMVEGLEGLKQMYPNFGLLDLDKLLGL
ncbi:MAG: isoprenylcysteine carboxylmethyltransferase family protein [Rickettsiales bacterium]|jgi:protein-S-isoprenylcysteine O-methyltransferase Ste14|nr:isoprenylcysteine carboxylmethyltransferase family protein [Rickettsiales bacterium]